MSALQDARAHLAKAREKSQYSAASVTAADAAKAVDWATRLLQVAEEVVSLR